MSAPWTCLHREAEPVTLTTGETVAAVCTSCLDPLPAGWLDCLAKGGHYAAFEVTTLGDPHRRYGCGRCGGIYQEVT